MASAPRAALTCLRLLLLLSAADSRPHAWDQDRFQLEAVKKEILERLGMPAPPAIRSQLDQESIQRAQRLYRRKVAELAGNRSREEEEEEAVSRLYRLTPTCKWPWLRVAPRPRCPSVSRPRECHPAARGHDRACSTVAALILIPLLPLPWNGEGPLLEPFCLKPQKNPRGWGGNFNGAAGGGLGVGLRGFGGEREEEVRRHPPHPQLQLQFGGLSASGKGDLNN